MMKIEILYRVFGNSGQKVLAYISKNILLKGFLKPIGGYPGVVHLIKYAFKIFWRFLQPAKKRVDFKNRNIALMLLGAFRDGLGLKTRRVLKNSGNFLSNEHKNFIILFRNDREK